LLDERQSVTKTKMLSEEFVKKTYSFNSQVRRLDIQYLLDIERMCDQQLERYSERVGYELTIQLLEFRDEIIKQREYLQREERVKMHFKLLKLYKW
jgi:hypothetical protein